MSDDNHLPKRAVSVDDDHSAMGDGVGAFRTVVRKAALPAVLVMAVSSGLAFGGLAPKGAETVSAEPAPAVAMPARDAETVSRNFDRASIDEALAAGEPTAPAGQPEDTKPAVEESPAGPADEAAPRPEAKALTAITPEEGETALTTGRAYASTNVNVRSDASVSSDRIASVSSGESVAVTGRTDNGFTQVNVNGKTGWISSDYVSKDAPKAPAPAASSARSSAPAVKAAAPAAAPAARSCAPLPGLQARTAAVHQALCANFPAITSYGGVRADWDVEHPSGRAIDAMTSNQAVGDAVANWARANAGQYGITEVIWNQRIWTTQRAGEGWRMMSDRGSATANHRDHVHISVR